MQVENETHTSTLLQYCVLQKELTLKSMSIEMLIKINNHVGREQEVYRVNLDVRHPRCVVE